MNPIQHLKNYFSPAIVSRILQGAFYVQAVIDISDAGFLLAPAMDLAPMHVNCARIIFPYSIAVMDKIFKICARWDVAILLDSIATYGLAGQPIYVKDGKVIK